MNDAVKEYILDTSYDKEPDKNSMKIPPMIVRNLRAKKMEHVREIDSMLKNKTSSNIFDRVEHQVETVRSFLPDSEEYNLTLPSSSVNLVLPK